MLCKQNVFLTESRIKKYLDSVDIIVPFEQTHNMNVAEYYNYCDGRKNDLLKIRTVIEELYLEYLKDYDAFHRLLFTGSSSVG